MFQFVCRQVRSEKGFSLVELIVSLAILSAISIPLAGNFVRGADFNQLAREKLKMGQLAQQYMEQLKNRDSVDLTTQNLSDVSYGDRTYAVKLTAQTVGSGESYQFPAVTAVDGDLDIRYDGLTLDFNSGEFTNSDVQTLTMQATRSGDYYQLDFFKNSDPVAFWQFTGLINGMDAIPIVFHVNSAIPITFAAGSELENVLKIYILRGNIPDSSAYFADNVTPVINSEQINFYDDLYDIPSAFYAEDPPDTDPQPRLYQLAVTVKDPARGTEVKLVSYKRVK